MPTPPGAVGPLARLPREIERVFPATTAAISDVRVWLRTHLTTLELEADTVHTAELLISEVATNALKHAQTSQIIVRLITDHVLEAAVRDTASGALPRVAQPDLEESSGRGLLLVDALATEWGATVTSHGKWVWFRLPLS